MLVKHMSAFDPLDTHPSIRLTSQTSTDGAAQCLDCDAGHTGKTTGAWAHNHARMTGHSVALTFGYIVHTISNSVK